MLIAIPLIFDLEVSQIKAEILELDNYEDELKNAERVYKVLKLDIASRPNDASLPIQAKATYLEISQRLQVSDPR